MQPSANQPREWNCLTDKSYEQKKFAEDIDKFLSGYCF